MEAFFYCLGFGWLWRIAYRTLCWIGEIRSILLHNLNQFEIDIFLYFKVIVKLYVLYQIQDLNIQGRIGKAVERSHAIRSMWVIGQILVNLCHNFLDRFRIGFVGNSNIEFNPAEISAG